MGDPHHVVDLPCVRNHQAEGTRRAGAHSLPERGLIVPARSKVSCDESRYHGIPGADGAHDISLQCIRAVDRPVLRQQHRAVAAQADKHISGALLLELSGIWNRVLAA